jgi:hypothetical protein
MFGTASSVTTAARPIRRTNRRWLATKPMRLGPVPSQRLSLV